MLHALVSAIAFVVLLCTGSRNAYLAFFVVFLALLVFCYLGRAWLTLKIMAGILVLSCLIIGVAAPQFISDRLDRDISQDGRVYLTQVAVQLIEEKPYIGIGLGRWGEVYHERFEAENPFHEKIFSRRTIFTCKFGMKRDSSASVDFYTHFVPTKSSPRFTHRLLSRPWAGISLAGWIFLAYLSYLSLWPL